MINFYISGQSMHAVTSKIVADSINYLTATFKFETTDWDGAIKWAHFSKDETVYDIMLKNDAITEDMHLNLTEGIWNVYLHGNKDDQRITTDITVLHVYPTGMLNGQPLPDIPESSTEQILGLAQDAKDIAQSVRDDANNGLFDGEDGFSPVAKVEKVSGGSKISITDKTQTTETFVKDGIDGKDGTTPIKGKDYFTEADKKEFVTSIIDDNQIPSEASTEKVYSSKKIEDILEEERETTNNNFANAVKKTVSGSVVAVDNVSPVEHDIKVSVESTQLIPFPYSDTTKTVNGITFTVNPDRSITVNGTATANTLFFLSRKDILISEISTLGGVSEKGSTDSFCIACDVLTPNGKYRYPADVGNAMKLEKNETIKAMYISIKINTVCNNLIFKPMLNKGTQALPYTPYVADLTKTKVVEFRRNGANYNDIEITLQNATQLSFENRILKVAGNEGSGVNAWSSGWLQIFPKNNLLVGLNSISVNVKLNKISKWNNFNIRGFFRGTEEDKISEELKLNEFIRVKFQFENGHFKPRKQELPFVMTLSGNEMEFDLNTLQIEYDGVTPYEPYQPPTEFIPLPDGTIEGMKSISPNMTLLSDTEGIRINAEYNVDTNKILDDINLENYYTKSESNNLLSEKPSKNEMDTAIKTSTSDILKKANEYTDKELATFDFIKIMEQLPTEGLPNRLYLIPKALTQTNDLFDEYIWANGKWEWITTKQMEVDLGEYYKKADIDGFRKEDKDYADNTFAEIVKVKAEGNPIVLKDSAEAKLVGLEINGSTKQDGVPTPDAPVDIINGVFDTVQCDGKNLLDTSRLPNTYDKGHIKFTKNIDGTIHIKGNSLSPSGGYSIVVPKNERKIFHAGTYSVKRIFVEGKDIEFYATARHLDGSFFRNIDNKNITLDDSFYIDAFGVYVSKGINNIDVIVSTQFELGLDSTLYEPYKGFSESIVPVELSKWNRIVKNDSVWEKENNSDSKLYDGKDSEMWASATFGSNKDKTRFTIKVPNIKPNTDKNKPAQIYCNQYKSISNAEQWEGTEGIVVTSSGSIFIYNSKISTLSEWINFLKNNNLQVVYETENSTYEELPQETQDVLNNIQTFYPNSTIQTNNGIELNLTYLSDTKNYIDNNFVDNYTFEKVTSSTDDRVDANTQSIKNVESVAHRADDISKKNKENISALERTKADITYVDEKLSLDDRLANYFNLHRTGKVFSTKFYKFTTSQSSAGEKLNNNKGLVCEPSTDIIAGRDDYQQYGLFQHFTCNWIVDENGFIHITALEGDDNFKKTGEVQVGEVTCNGWIGVEDLGDSYIVSYSDKKSEKTPVPMKESINPDGIINPWMVHAKYLAADIDGKSYSSAGNIPANYNRYMPINTSYSSQISWHHKHGNQYSGLCSCDLFYRQVMLMIKYATINSQSVMAGCTGYSIQYMAAVAEENVSHVTIKTSEAKNLVIGSYVSVGEMGEETSKDRYSSHMHNLAYDVKILNIKPVDDVNSIIELDTTPFNTSQTTCVSTFHWRTGSTDSVLGSDGSPNSNTDYKNPCKIQGIEYSLGGYEVLGNVIMDIVTGDDGIPLRDVYICDDAKKLTSDISLIRNNYKKTSTQIPFTNASWKYISEVDIDINAGIMIPKSIGAGSATGFADGLYTDVATSGQREFLSVGYLRGGSLAGLWCLDAYYGLSASGWNCLAGVSPNGIRGEYRA